MYSALQKALLPPVVVVPCIVILYAMFRFGKRPLQGTYTFGDRMEPFYSFVAAALLGQFLFQTLPNATGPSGPQIGAFVSLFVMVGFFIMLCIQKYQRVSHANPYYVAPENNSTNIVSSLDHATMELVEFYHATDLESEEVVEDRLRLADENAELRKRRRIHILTVIIMSILCGLEGFFLAYRDSSWMVLIFFTANKIIETFVLCVSMLHAFIQATTERQPRWYLYTSIWWIIVTILSILPMLLDMPYDAVYMTVNHLATNIFYALAGGFLFWIALYYIWIDRKRVDKRDTIVRLVIFGATGGISWLVGFFT